MDPNMKWIANKFKTRFVLPNGVTFRSMMIKTYFPGNQVFKDVDDGSFKTS
jgi:hypothetical protein